MGTPFRIIANRTGLVLHGAVELLSGFLGDFRPVGICRVRKFHTQDSTLSIKTTGTDIHFVENPVLQNGELLRFIFSFPFRFVTFPRIAQRDFCFF